MSDARLVLEILANILTAIERIERRFQDIETPEDFLTDNTGLDKLDGIAMMLIAMGEQLKHLEKVSAIDLSALYPEIDWKGAKGIRDFLSHHYFILDAEVIFDVCKNKIDDVKQSIQSLQSNIQQK